MFPMRYRRENAAAINHLITTCPDAVYNRYMKNLGANIRSGFWHLEVVVARTRGI